MRSHDLAKLLLNKPDDDVCIAVTLVDDINHDRRIYCREIVEVTQTFSGPAEVIVCVDGEFNMTTHMSIGDRGLIEVPGATGSIYIE